MPKDQTQFIKYLRLQPDNLYGNHDVSLGEKTGVEKGKMIDIVIHIHIQKQNVVLEEDLIKNVKFVRESIIFFFGMYK